MQGNLLLMYRSDTEYIKKSYKVLVELILTKAIKAMTNDVACFFIFSQDWRAAQGNDWRGYIVSRAIDSRSRKIIYTTCLKSSGRRVSNKCFPSVTLHTMPSISSIIHFLTWASFQWQAIKHTMQAVN